MRKDSPRGKLFLVGTPIGNLEDFSLRCQRVIQEADVVMAEDTRSVVNLANHFHFRLSGRLLSFYKDKESTATQKALSLLREGKNVALVSKSGMPLVADPGSQLVRFCRQEGIDVIPVAGPSAFLLALVASGFSVQKFCFLGFLPRDRKKIKATLEECRLISKSSSINTFCFYESPYRIGKTLSIIEEGLGNIPLFVAEEMTKMFEKGWQTTVEEAKDKFFQNKPRGEITVAFSLAKKD